MKSKAVNGESEDPQKNDGPRVLRGWKGLKDERHAKQNVPMNGSLNESLNEMRLGAYGCSESLQKLSMNDLKI